MVPRCCRIVWLAAMMLQPREATGGAGSAVPGPREVVARFVKKQLGKSQPDASLPPEGWTPVGITHDEAAGSGLDCVSVQFCHVNFGAQKVDPVRVPFHADFVAASGCHNPDRQVSLTVEQLLPAVVHLEGKATKKWGGLPTGVVLHTARSGSTAVANMIAAAPLTVLLSEPQFMFDALVMAADEQLSVSELTVLLRLLAQLTTSGAAEQLQLQAGAKPQLFLKLMSNVPLLRPAQGYGSSLKTLQQAWPAAAWAFTFRAPIEVVAAQLAVSEGSSTVIKLAAASKRHALSRIPCLGSRAFPGQLVNELLDEAGITPQLPPGLGPMALTAEAYCAAHVGALLRSVVEFSEHLETQAYSHGSRGNPVLFLDHTEIPGAVLTRLFPYFGIQLEGADARAHVAAIGRRDAKNVSASAAVGYVSDSERKRGSASAAAVAWTRLPRRSEDRVWTTRGGRSVRHTARSRRPPTA